MRTLSPAGIIKRNVGNYIGGTFRKYHDMRLKQLFHLHRMTVYITDSLSHFQMNKNTRERQWGWLFGDSLYESGVPKEQLQLEYCSSSRLSKKQLIRTASTSTSGSAESSSSNSKTKSRRHLPVGHPAILFSEFPQITRWAEYFF